MPPKEITPYKIGIMTEDGFHELGSNIEDITLEPEEHIEATSLEESASVIFNGFRSFECTFELKENIKWRNVFYGSNNFRRMHGLPMIRRWIRRYGNRRL